MLLSFSEQIETFMTFTFGKIKFYFIDKGLLKVLDIPC